MISSVCVYFCRVQKCGVRCFGLCPASGYDCRLLDTHNKLTVFVDSASVPGFAAGGGCAVLCVLSCVLDTLRTIVYNRPVLVIPLVISFVVV